jgi:hypothetical protein
MHFIEYRPKNLIEQIEKYRENPRWYLNSKWRQKNVSC